MAGYTTVWEFSVRGDRQAEFEHHYRPDGTWVALFRRADGYIGTQFLKDRNDPLRYLTIDHWTGLEAYRAFRAKYAELYASLDRECEELTTRESALGEYDEE
jgi:heme-degrading monooxygenase HmoA